jgi:1,2-diacylglycerol 3-alpha-glucosyltransferase
LLKIAIVTNNYKPYSGGVVSSIDSYATTLKSLGHKVFIITLDFLNVGSSPEENIYRIKCPIRFKYKNNIMALPWRANNAVSKLLKELSPDIVHSQHPFLLGQSALNVSRKLNIPIVFTYHTQYELYLHYIPLPQFMLKSLLKKITQNYCNSVNGIIAPSNLIKNYLLDNGIIKPIKVIPSGILPIFIISDFKERKINYPVKLLTVSRFVKEKNIKFLLEAFSRLDQNKFEFTLVGYGAYLPQLKNYAFNILGLKKENLKFIQKPAKENLVQYYRDSDLFIFSSKSETQGLVLAEAMSSGRPVVALNAPGSDEIVVNNVNGFLVQDVNEMCQKINYIVNNLELFKQMQYNAWLSAQKYNPINTTNSLIDFYNHLITLHK